MLRSSIGHFSHCLLKSQKWICIQPSNMQVLGNGRNSLCLDNCVAIRSVSSNSVDKNKNYSEIKDGALSTKKPTEDYNNVVGDLPDYINTEKTRRESIAYAKSKYDKKIFFENESPKELDFQVESENKESWMSQCPEDTFGTLAETADLKKGNYSNSYSNHSFRPQSNVFEDEEDEQPYRRLASSRRHVPVYYGKQIEKLCKEGKIYEAIEVLETKMLKEDRVMPTEYVFTCLIGALGRVGYTKKAFHLFNKMKKFGIKPSLPCYTALFNACSNSPWHKDGLERANRLRQLMIEKEIQPNAVNYRSMIKAFGVCGDLLTAFSLVDEMSQSFPPTEDTFAVLLVACISDKQAGLKHAIEVWRRMRKRKIEIKTKHYDLLLRAIRDCGLGDIHYANTLLQPNLKQESDNVLKVQENHQRLQDFRKYAEDSDNHHSGMLDTKENKVVKEHIPWWKYDYSKDKSSDNNTDELQSSFSHKIDKQTNLQLNEEKVDHFSVANEQDNVCCEVNLMNSETSSIDKNSSDIQNVDNKIIIPNILNPRVKLGPVFAIADVSTPEKRLGLFGGMDGMLGHIVKDKVEPNIKTFSLMLEMIPQTRKAERILINVMKTHNVKPDTDFVNMIIRRRNFRKDYQGAKDLLPWMSLEGLIPNIMTFGCMALGCVKKDSIVQLLKDMENVGILPNIEIYRTLLTRSRMDFFCKIQILKSMKETGVPPENNFLTLMEKSIQKARDITVKIEKRQNVPAQYKTPYFQDGFKAFNLYYAQWLRNQAVEKESHPWTQYHTPTPDTNSKVEEETIDEH